MPLTPAHPAAAVPLRGLLGRAASTSALAIGSMAPDLAYFVPLGVSGSQSHSLAGLLWFCVPVGLAAWVAYLLLLRQFLTSMLPGAISRRLDPPTAPIWSLAVVSSAAVCLLVGAVTHLAWDSFTHSTGVAVRALPALQARVPLTNFYTPQVFTVLQHLSSAAGLVILAVLAARWYARSAARPETDPGTPPWAKVCGLLSVTVPGAVTGLVVLASRMEAGGAAFRVLQISVGRATVAAGTVSLASLVATALAWRVAGRRSPRPTGLRPRGQRGV